jgi:hypothetical protein
MVACLHVRDRSVLHAVSCLVACVSFFPVFLIRLVNSPSLPALHGSQDVSSSNPTRLHESPEAINTVRFLALLHGGEQLPLAHRLAPEWEMQKRCRLIACSSRAISLIRPFRNGIQQCRDDPEQKQEEQTCRENGDQCATHG